MLSARFINVNNNSKISLDKNTRCATPRSFILETLAYKDDELSMNGLVFNFG